MADARIKVVVDSSGAETGARKVSKSLNEISRSAIKVNNETAKTQRALSTLGKSTSSANNFLMMFGNTLSGYLGVHSLIQFNKELVNTALNLEKVEKRLNYVTGSVKKTTEELDYIRSITKRYSLDLESNIDAYSRFIASVKGTAVTTETARKVFEAFSKASAVLGLNVERTRLVFMALQQMMSKNRVSSEELRQQLGESLSGAMNLARKATGLTAEEFDKLLKKGLDASVFMEDFADTVDKEFDKMAKVSAKGLNAEVNNLKTSFYELKEEIVKSDFGQSIFGNMLLTFTDLNKEVRFWIKSLKEFAKEPAMIKFSKFVSELSVLMKSGTVKYTADKTTDFFNNMIISYQSEVLGKKNTQDTPFRGLIFTDQKNKFSPLLSEMPLSDEEFQKKQNKKYKAILEKNNKAKKDSNKEFKDSDMQDWEEYGTYLARLQDDMAREERKKLAERVKGYTEFNGEVYFEWEKAQKDMLELEVNRLSKSQEMMKNWAESNLDSITDFVLGAKSSFSDLINSLIQDFTRLQVKQGLQSLLPSLFNTGLQAVPQKQIVDLSSQLQDFAFSMNPAVPSGISLPKMSPSVYQRPTAQSISSVQVINNSGVNAKTEETTNADGSKNIKVIVDSIVNQSFSQGKYDKTMQGRFVLAKKGSR